MRKLMVLFLMAAVGLVFGDTVRGQGMGTAVTYQGRLMDGGSPANNIYDFEFKLYDALAGGKKYGRTELKEDVPVYEGHFTVVLDFVDDPNVFNGEARWLQIGVRPGATSGSFTTLSPRQELTPTPYAIYAKNAGSDNDWMVSGNDMYAIPPGNLGIGTTGPDAKLDVAGVIAANTNGADLAPGAGGTAAVFGASGSMVGGAYGDGAVSGLLYSASAGASALYGKAYGGGTGLIVDQRGVGDIVRFQDLQADVFVIKDGGNVGIGTTSPGGELHIKTGTGGGSSPLTNADRLVIESGGLSYINQISATTGFGGIYFSDDIRGRGWVQYAHSSDVLSFGAAGFTRLRIDPTGNVGIGTNSPATKLDVNGTITATGGNSGNWNTAYGWGNHAGAGYLTSYTETDPTVAASVKNGVSWGELSAIPAGFADGVDDVGAGDSDWTISGIDMYTGAGVTGNVGIGTTEPDATLEVNGDLKVTGSILTGDRVAFYAYNSANDVFTSGAFLTTKVEFDTELYDEGNDYDTANDRFVAPTDGIYNFCAKTDLYDLGSSCKVYLNINGGASSRYIHSGQAASGNNTQYGGSVDLKLNSGDYVEVVFYSSDGNLTIAGSASANSFTYFCGHRVY